MTTNQNLVRRSYRYGNGLGTGVPELEIWREPAEAELSRLTSQSNVIKEK